MFESIDYTS
jgi:hypothetical protein